MIIPGMPIEAKLAAVRSLAAPADEVCMALYGQEAHISPTTSHYTTDGEVRAKGYVAGGKKLEGYVSGVDGATAYVNWTENPVWPVASIRAKGALIYNRSKNNIVLSVVEFDELVISTNGPFVVPMPKSTALTAVLRIT